MKKVLDKAECDSILFSNIHVKHVGWGWVGVGGVGGKFSPYVNNLSQMDDFCGSL